MLPIEYLPGARCDFDESFDWYAERSPQTALRFLDAIDVALGRISNNPSFFSTSDGVHRECPVKKFPFRIVYRITEDCLLVVAIAHAKRDPVIGEAEPDSMLV